MRSVSSRMGRGRGGGPMVNVATDGESYGHHFKFGDRTVAHALEAAGRELPADQTAALTELTRRDLLIVDGVVRPYTNPLPHVLILTAIVVSVSTLAVALAIIVWIRREFGTIEDDELTELELEVNNDAKGGEA